jgi:hypothetical protein
VIVAAFVVIAALALASYEMWRRRKPEGRERDPLETSDPPPHIYSDDGGDGADGADGGD